MGTVYQGDQLKPLRRTVALKVIRRGMEAVEVLARFESEPEALAVMEHPNIAKALDAGTTDYFDRHGLDLRRRLGATRRSAIWPTSCG